MELLRQLWSWFAEISPLGFEPQSGAFGAASALLLLLVGLVWKAWSKTMADAIGVWLQNQSRMSFVSIALGSILIGAVMGAVWTAGGLLLLAAVVAVRQWRSPAPWTTWALVLLFGGLLAVSLPTEALLQQHVRRVESERLKVYVVLSLRDDAGETASRLHGLSMSLRDTVDAVFGAGSEVRIEPASLTLDEFHRFRDLSTVVERLRDEGLPPDVVLETRARLVTVGSETYITFSPVLKIDDGEGGFDEYKKQQITGRRNHFTYLVLRACLDIIEELAKSKHFELEETERHQLVTNVLEEYEAALGTDLQALPAARAEVRAALDDPPTSLVRTREIITAYPADESSIVRNAIAARSSAALAKLGPSRDTPSPPAPSPAAAESEAP